MVSEDQENLFHTENIIKNINLGVLSYVDSNCKKCWTYTNRQHKSKDFKTKYTSSIYYLAHHQYFYYNFITKNVTGYIDLSKRRVSAEDIDKCTERYAKAKAVNSILRHVAELLHYESSEQLEELYKRTAWLFEEKYKKKASAYDFFKQAAVWVLFNVATYLWSWKKNQAIELSESNSARLHLL